MNKIKLIQYVYNDVGCYSTHLDVANSFVSNCDSVTLCNLHYTYCSSSFSSNYMSDLYIT